MTKSEQRKMRRLEIMVDEQRSAISRHMEVYREISLENIELRSRIAHIEEMALALASEIQGVR